MIKLMDEIRGNQGRYLCILDTEYNSITLWENFRFVGGEKVYIDDPVKYYISIQDIESLIKDRLGDGDLFVEKQDDIISVVYDYKAVANDRP